MYIYIRSVNLVHKEDKIFCNCNLITGTTTLDFLGLGI